MLISKMPSGPKIITGPITNFSVTNFKTTTSRYVSFSWTNPTSKYFAGVMIRYKTGSYPTSISDGAQIYNGTGSSFSTSALNGGTKYYFRAFPYAKNKSGTKTVYNTSTDTQQSILNTLNSPVSLYFTGITTTSLTVNWSGSTDTDRGLYVTYKAGSYPVDANDGTHAYVNWNTQAGSASVSGLTPGTTYYFQAFTHNSDGVWSTYENNKASTKARVASGYVAFTSSGYWTCPAGVTNVTAFCVGGGAAGSPWIYDGAITYASAGGNGGYTKTVSNIAVTPGSSYPVVVGAGGNGQASTGHNGACGYGIYNGSTTSFNAASGGASSFGSACVAAGGEGIQIQTGTTKYTKVNRGGSGGGGLNANGGSDGSNGVGTNAGLGQGTNTRHFGNPAEALYAGGGGGGAIGGSNPGMGGAGGGANGVAGTTGLSATANTGGGGGGTNVGMSGYYGGSGGSGYVAIWWPEQ